MSARSRGEGPPPLPPAAMPNAIAEAESGKGPKSGGGPPPIPRRGPPPPPPPRAKRASESVGQASSPSTALRPPPLSADLDGLLRALHGFLERELEHVPAQEGRTRAILLFELGVIEELAFGEMVESYQRFEAGFAADKSLLSPLRALRRRCSELERWGDVSALVLAELPLTESEAARAALLAELGSIHQRQMDDPAGATEYLERALGLVPHNRWALELLAQAHRRAEDWEPLLEVTGRLATLTSDGHERARLHVAMAEVAELQLGRPQQAEELYAEALELDSNNQKAALALRRLYLLHHRWRPLGELLVAEAGREHEPDEMFADIYRAARIAELELTDDVRAASLLETAAALRPNDLLPLRALAEIYRRGGKHEELVSVLRRQLALQRDPGARAELCYRLGRVLEAWLDRDDEALESYQKGLAELPSHEATLDALGALYRKLKRTHDLFELELLRAERHRDERLRVAAYVRAAQIAEHELGDFAQARLLNERAWALDPKLSEPFRSLERLYRHGEHWEALAGLYEQRAERTPDSSFAASLLRLAAAIYEEQLGQSGRAIAVLERIDALDAPQHETVIQLARLYERVGQSVELKAALARWASATNDDLERLALLRRIGELCDGPLRQSEEAVTAFRRVLVVDPKERSARLGLKGVLERSGRWDTLVDVIAEEVDLVDAPHERAALLLAQARIWEGKLGAPDKACAAYRKALELDPRSTPVALAYEESLRRQQEWRLLAEHLTWQAEQARELHGRSTSSLLCQAAELYESLLEDSAAAEQLFGQALEVDPFCLAAAHGLERLYLVAGDRSALEAHYLREAEGAQNPVLRVRAYLRLAALFESAPGGADEPGAIAAYESALRVEEDHPEALASLIALYRRAGKHERLVALLGRVAATAEDRDAAVAALKEWAAIIEQHFADRWDPEPIYRRVLEGDPEDSQAVAALDALAHRKRDLQGLLNLAVRQARRAETPTLEASLWQRAAIVLLVGGKPQEAIELLRRGLKREPTYLPTLQLLRRLDERADAWDEAVTLLEREAELSHFMEARHHALLRAGNILVDRFADGPRAVKLFAAVFDVDPTSGAAFGRLTELLSAGGEWTRLADAYQRRMAAVTPSARTPLQLQLALVYRDHLEDLPRATEVLGALLATDPEHLRALDLSAALCVLQQRWREAEQFLARVAAVTGIDDRGRHALLHRAEILERRLGEQEQALESLGLLLERDPEDREALSRSVAIYRQRKDWERTVELLGRLVSRGDDSERVQGLVGLAELYARSLGEPERAEECLARAAGICAESGAGIDEVTTYFERRGDFSGLEALWGRVLDTLPPEGAAGAVDVRLARAKILAARLLRPADAEAEIVAALRVAPNSLPARLELAGLHLWGDNLGEAATEYLRVLDRDSFMADAYRGLYRVFDRRGDLDRAAGAAQALLALGAADEVERTIADQTRLAVGAALPSAAATPLGKDGYWQFLAYDSGSPAARELLLALGDHLPVLFSAELEEQAGARLIAMDSEHEWVRRCDLWAQVLGVDAVGYFLASQPLASQSAGSLVARQGSGALTLAGAPPRLVLSEALMELGNEAELRFQIGRALGHVLGRTFYLSGLGPKRVALLLAAAVEVFQRGSGALLAGGSEQIDELVRRISKGVPRRARKLLEEPALAYARNGAVDAKQWVEAAERAAERAGLLLSGDMGAALSVLKRERASRRVQAELLRFAAGPHLYEARQRLGIAL